MSTVMKKNIFLTYELLINNFRIQLFGLSTTSLTFWYLSRNLKINKKIGNSIPGSYMQYCGHLDLQERLKNA